MTVLLGLNDLANQLADPFGDDDVDFPLNAWTAGLVEKVSLIADEDQFDVTGSVYPSEPTSPRAFGSINLFAKNAAERGTTWKAAQLESRTTLTPRDDETPLLF